MNECRRILKDKHQVMVKSDVDMAAEEEAELVETLAADSEEEILVKEVKTQQTQDVKVTNKDDNLDVADYKNEAMTEVHETTIKAPMWRILLLCTMGCASDMAYAIISCYITPLVVATGLELQYTSIALVLSPILGILALGCVGSASDKSQCRWGKRRPFILASALLMIFGFSVTPFVPLLSTVVSTRLTIATTLIGAIIIDFSAGQVQVPIRAYLMDSVPIQQAQSSNFIYTMFVGMGSSIGYLASAINWAEVIGRDINIINETCFIFPFMASVTTICLVMALCSFKEKPPITPRSCCGCGNGCGFITSVYQMYRDAVRFVWYMSKEMWVLCVATFLAATAEFTFTYFFTTFVGEVVYKGVSDAPEWSDEYQDYVKGVRMGAWALTLGGVTMSLLSLCEHKVANLIGLKTLFIVIQSPFVFATCILTFYNSNVGVVIVLGSFTGPYLGVLMSIPFTLVSLYQVIIIMVKTFITYPAMV